MSNTQQITRRRLLRKRNKTASPAAKPDFVSWLNIALRDERWRAAIRDRLVQAELREIQY